MLLHRLRVNADKTGYIVMVFLFCHILVFKDPVKIIIWAPLCVKFVYIVSNTKAFLAQLFSKLI